MFIEFWHVHIWNIHGIYRVHTICNDCSLDRLIFVSERIEMGANKYRKGIRNSSANSVKQADSRNRPRSSEWPNVTPGWAAGVGWGGAGHDTAVHGRAGLGKVG